MFLCCEILWCFIPNAKATGSAGRDVGQWPHYCQINSPTPPPPPTPPTPTLSGWAIAMVFFFFCKPVVLLCCRTLVSLSLSSVSGVLPRQCKVLCAIPRFIGYKVEDPSRTKWGNDCLIENKDCKTLLRCQGDFPPFSPHCSFLEATLLHSLSYMSVLLRCYGLLAFHSII